MTPSLTPSLSDLISDPSNASLLASPAPKVSLAPQPAGVPMLRNLIGDQTPSPAPAPLVDNSGLTSLPPLPGTLRPLVTNPRAEQEQRLQARIDAYDMPHPSQPGFWHKLGAIAGKVGNVIGNDFLPHTMAMIPGTDLYKQVQDANATQQLNTMRGEDQTLLNNNSKRALEGAQTSEAQERTSEMPAKNESDLAYQAAQTHNIQNPPDTNPDMATYRSLVKIGMSPSEALQEIERDKALALKPPTEQHVPVLGDDGKPTFANYNPTSSSWTDPSGNPIKNPRPIPPANAGGQVTMVIPQADGSNKVERVGPGQTVGAGAVTASQFGTENSTKPTATEQNRADFAENLNENLNKLEEVVNRRPQLFGPVLGRIAEAKQMLGSNDPDLGTLKTLEEQMGMVQQSTHGMRSASGVQAAAQSILNNLHNGPDAIKASIKTARDSVKTFTDDANRGKSAQQGGQSGGTIRAYDDKGVLHEAPAGTPLPKGWRLQ